MVFLTIALMLAAEVADPTDYRTSVDARNSLRLFCEVCIILRITTDIGNEITDFCYTQWVHPYMQMYVLIVSYVYCCPSSERSLKRYFGDWSNWLDITAIVLTLLIIPFRITGLSFQWMFAALAYTVHGLRIFKYAIMVS